MPNRRQFLKTCAALAENSCRVGQSACERPLQGQLR